MVVGNDAILGKLCGLANNCRHPPCLGYKRMSETSAAELARMRRAALLKETDDMSGPPPTTDEMLAGFHSTTKAVVEEQEAMAEEQEIETPEPIKRGRGRPRKDAPPEPPKNAGTPAQMRSIVDRIVRLVEEKEGLSNDIKEILMEADSLGFAKAAVRLVVKREMETSDKKAAREAVEEEAETIIKKLGDLASTPLGEAALGGRR